MTQYPVLGIDSHACKEEIDDRLDDHGLHLHVSRSHIAAGSAEVDEPLRAESGREYVGEHLPESRERYCRPGAACQEQSHRRHRQEENEHGLPPRDQRAPDHAEEHTVSDEEDQHRKNIQELSPLRDSEYGGDDEGDVHADGKIQQPVGTSAPKNDTYESASFKPVRKRGETMISFPCSPHQQGHSIEHGLLDDDHQDGRDQEETVAESPVVGIVVLVAKRLDCLGRGLFRHPEGREPLHLDLTDLMKHHEVGGHESVLVVEETAHVRIDGECGCLVSGQFLREVGREIDDTVDLAFLHHLFRLGHIHTFRRDIHLSCGVDLPDEATAVRAVTVVDNSHRCLRKNTIQIDNIVQQWVKKPGDKEDQQHATVRENLSEFMAEYAPKILEPIFRI